MLLCEIQKWGRQRREAYPVCFRSFGHAETTSFRRLCHSPFICPAVCCLPICPSLLGLQIGSRIFRHQIGSPLQSFAFLRVDAFLFFRQYNLLFPETVVVAVCLYGYVLPTESVSLFFRSRFLFYRGATSSDTWNIVCFILRLHFFKRNCRGFFRCVDRRQTIFSECAMLSV